MEPRWSHVYSNSASPLPSPEVAIGLERTEYSVMETQGTVELCSRLMEGLLERSVLVTLSTEIEGMFL